MGKGGGEKGRTRERGGREWKEMGDWRETERERETERKKGRGRCWESEADGSEKGREGE